MRKGTDFTVRSCGLIALQLSRLSAMNRESGCPLMHELAGGVGQAERS